MNRGGSALDYETTLLQASTNKDFLVSNCGYFIAENSPYTMNCPTYNEGFLLIYLHKGRVKLPLANGKSQILNGGTVVIFKPHEKPCISYLSDPINERYYIYFEGKNAQALIEKFKLNDKRYYEVGDLSSQIKTFHKIIDDFKYRELDDNIFRTTYFLNILAAISNTVTPPPQSYYPKAFKEILDTIEQIYFKKLSLCDLANTFSISSSTLRRYFKRYTGTSPMEYINDIRFDKAKFMLIESDMQISEISYSVGFEDALYFSKFFKAKTGLSPKEFRKKFKPFEQRKI